MPGQFTVYGHPFSNFFGIVITLLDDAGFTDYDIVKIDLGKGEQKQPEYLERHPFGKVPALKLASGEHIYESHAISKYLASKYAKYLLPDPSDLLAVARFDEAENVNLNYAMPISGKFLFNLGVKPLLGIPVDPQAVETERKEFSTFLDVLENIFAKTGRKFVAGDSFTLADIFYLPTMFRVNVWGEKNLIDSRPNLKAWFERCVERPAIGKRYRDQPTLEDMKKQFKKD